MTVRTGRYRTCRRQSPSVRRDARRGDPYGDAARARIRVRPHRRRMRARDSRSFTNVVEALGIEHQHSPWGVRPSVGRRWLQSSLLANPSKGIFERNRGPAAGGSPYHSGCRPRCSTYWDCVSPLHPREYDILPGVNAGVSPHAGVSLTRRDIETADQTPSLVVASVDDLSGDETVGTPSMTDPGEI